MEKKKTFWTTTRVINSILLVVTFVFNILFAFVPLGGETGFNAAKDISPFLAIILEAILLYAFFGTLYFYIKDK